MHLWAMSIMKNHLAECNGWSLMMEGTVLYLFMREILTEKMTVVQGCKGNENMSHMAIWGKIFQTEKTTITTDPRQVHTLCDIGQEGVSKWTLMGSQLRKSIRDFP